MPSLVNAEPRVLGSLGPVGPIAYGQWRADTGDVAAAGRLVETALDAGLNLIDTADIYGFEADGTGFGAVEDLLGRVLAGAPGLRDRMVLATKGGIRPPLPYDSSPGHLTAACEDSLRRLGVDTIDLFQIHRPDLYAHPAAVAGTLAGLRESGKIREVGVSNHTVAQTNALQAHLPFPLVSTQPEFSVTTLDPMFDGTFDLCTATGLTALAWSPLAGGRLATGDDVDAAVLGLLDEIADREGVDRSVVALAFVLAHPAEPVAIIGTQQPQRIIDSARALEVHLDRTDVYALIEASTGERLP
ncbi:MAG: aldo/keto reductase [Ilumatobacteraceae bacterium]